MNKLIPLVFGAASVASGWVDAGVLVITSYPDSANASSEVLKNSAGEALASTAKVQVGALPGMNDDQILDMAKSGLASVESAWVPFGEERLVGSGTGGDTGRVETSFRQVVASGSPLVGEEITVLINYEASGEFLIARFKGRAFTSDPDTGLETLTSLHLAEAELISGNYLGKSGLATAAAPSRGSFASWIRGFSNLEGVDLDPDGDPDKDGLSNLLEYATGGDPTSGGAATCWITPADTDGFWIQFPLVDGLGIQPKVEASPDLVLPWETMDGSVEVDASMAPSGDVRWLRVKLPASPQPAGFFRLVLE